MQYSNLEEGVFIERKNRFVAEIEVNGVRTFAHVPNTGRCKEIFVPGAKVIVSRSPNPNRKYAYTLLMVYKNDMLIHIDSAGANRLVEEALAAKKIKGLEDVTEVKREQTFGRSRFDFRFQKGETVCYMEVKGVTLEENGVAKFPDAPTERGARHLSELMAAAAAGYGAYVLFVIQMKGVTSFTPFLERDPRFTENLVKASRAGVAVMAYDTIVTPENITLDRAVDIYLPKGEEL